MSVSVEHELHIRARNEMLYTWRERHAARARGRPPVRSARFLDFISAVTLRSPEVTSEPLLSAAMRSLPPACPPLVDAASFGSKNAPGFGGGGGGGGPFPAERPRHVSSDMTLANARRVKSRANASSRQSACVGQSGPACPIAMFRSLCTQVHIPPALKRQLVQKQSRVPHLQASLQLRVCCHCRPKWPPLQNQLTGPT